MEWPALCGSQAIKGFDHPESVAGSIPAIAIIFCVGGRDGEARRTVLYKYFMKNCKHCGQEAKYPPKTKWSGWCCSERFYDCPGYKQKLHDNANIWNKGKKGIQVPWNKGSKNGTFKGKKHNLETLKKISDGMKGNRNANHRGDRQSFYNNIRMDSKWEVATAKYFDQHNISWKYSEAGYKLSNGCYYYPDFFIYENDTLNKLVEVKGYFREANKKKFQMFMDEYPNIVIELWDKNVLKQLKII